ncbi:MAG: four helix bundle protein [Bacteroidales bacterium]|nr:four helix bundle protein [Bacteroidales bacterium]
MANVVLDKSLDFAVRCVRFYNYLREEKHEFVLSKQIVRCGTSIGANICEGQGAQSNPDFIAQLHVSLKEARETAYWLLVLYRSEIISEAEYKSMSNDLDELISLLTSILKTTKKNTGQKILNS